MITSKIKLNINEGRWKFFFIFILSLWTTSIVSILFYSITGQEIVVDHEINLYYLSLPLLIVMLFYTALSLLILWIYIITYGMVKNWQQKSYLKTKITEDKVCSIIIGARNEESVIRNTVLKCLEQTYKNIEVIIICHNCSDKTYEQANVEDPRVKAIEYNTKEAGKGLALNFGVSKSNGEFLLILDADGVLSDDFVEKALPLLANYAAVQGRYIPSNRDYSFVSKLLGLEGDLWSTPYLTARTIIDKRGGLGGTGYIVKRKILAEVGGFSNHLVDDYELSSRILKSKHRIVFAPLCINYDEKPPNIEIMLRQRARWAKGFLDLLRLKVVEPSDLIGILYWLSPIAIFLSHILILIVGFGNLYNILFGYIPYYYASITVEQWICITLFLYISQSIALVRQYGNKGLKYSIYIPVYNIFILYVFVIFVKAFWVKSWGDTKTLHGFSKKNKL